MKKKYVAIVLALLCKCSIWAQDIKVKSFELDPTDLTAQHENVKDANGDMCALIKVQILAETVKFEGDIIGQPKHKLNEYYVNVIDGTQRLKLSTENTMPIEIEFSQFNIDEVKGGNTYVMKIQMPEKAPGATFELGMPNVPIIVDGKSYKTDDTGGLDLPLNKGKHTFCVSMQGYNSYEGTFEIDQLPVIKHIVMQRDYNLKNNGLLTITYPLNAEFLITPVNGAAKPKKQKIRTGEQIALNGEYQVSFVKKKYKPQTMTVSVDVGKEMKKGFTGVSLDADDRLASNDFSKAFNEYKKLADKGDDFAQYKVGCCYYDGKGVISSLPTAITYWRMAAEQGNMEACRKMVDVTYDNSSKKEWLKKLADNGDADAMLKLADLSKGNMKLQWLHKACDMNNAKAYFNLGQLYYEGKEEGIVQNYSRAYRYFLMAESLGYAKAQERILDYTYLGLDNQEVNKKKAVEGYEKMLANLSDDGLYKIGMYYYDEVKDMAKADTYFLRIKDIQLNNVHLSGLARGVFLNMAHYYEKKGESKSIFYYQLSACDRLNLQSPDVFVKLGNAFRLGCYVNVDYSKAFSYYKKASELNDKDGYCWLGFCYEKGYGVAADIDTAVQLYQKADQLGSSLASGYLGTMYAIGKGGLAKDIKKAEYLWKKAANAKPRQISAVRNLVKFYKNTKNQEEWQKWSKELEKLKELEVM